MRHDERALRVTRHAQLRQQQRNVTTPALTAAVDWGEEVHLRGGATAYHLGRRHRDRARRAGVDLPTTKDIVVIMGRDGEIRTVYPCPSVRRLRRVSR